MYLTRYEIVLNILLWPHTDTDNMTRYNSKDNPILLLAIEMVIADCGTKNSTTMFNF